MTELAKRMKTAEPSIVRELYKVWTLPGMHSLGAGNPSLKTFPVKEMEEISKQIYEECSRDHSMVDAIFSYGVTEGDDPLRKELKKRYMEYYKNGNPKTDDLQIFTGAQQVIDLTAKCFLNSGDVVLTEEHSYSGAISAFWGYEGKVVGVKTDEEGMLPDALEEMLQKEEHVKLIYLIPTFQNPMGIVTTLDRRQAIYDLAVKYDVMILEDSPYFELRYSGEYVPSIKSLDKTGHVIFAGSLSKVLTPGVRLGFAIANKNVLAKLTVGKQCQDMNNPGYNQRIAARYIENYDLSAHIQDCCTLYRSKRDTMMNALEKELTGKATWTHPEGGFFVWLTLPSHISGDEFTRYLIDKKKLITVCGSAYRPDGSDVNAIRLNFSVPSEEEIEFCVHLIREALEEWVDKA